MYILPNFKSCIYWHCCFRIKEIVSNTKIPQLEYKKSSPSLEQQCMSYTGQHLFIIGIESYTDVESTRFRGVFGQSGRVRAG